MRVRFLTLTIFSIAIGAAWGQKQYSDEQLALRDYQAMRFQERYLSHEWEIDLDAQLERGR